MGLLELPLDLGDLPNEIDAPSQVGVVGTERIAAELTTTFASSYSGEVSLAEALSLEAIGSYGKRATGAKVLVRPNGRSR